jgi:hypothetical protein
MSAQLGGSIVLGYRAQGARQSGAALLLSYSPPLAIQRRLMTGFGLQWVAGRDRHSDVRFPMAIATPTHSDARAHWGSGRGLSKSSRQPWGVARKAERLAGSAWGKYARTESLTPTMAWHLAFPRDTAATAPWGSYAHRLSMEQTAHWVTAIPANIVAIAPWGAYTGRPVREVSPSWQRSNTADMTRHLPWLRFSRALDAGWGVVIPIGGIGPDEPGVIVPIKKVYMIFNSVSLRRVDGNIALPNSSFTLSLDVDSWTWGFSAALPGSALPDLEPASSGAPVELEAMVNGTAFRVLVESIGSERVFGKHVIRAQGRGRTALLDSPYAPVRNFGNVAARTAQQLMGDALTVNGVAMDWAVTWGLEDWLVPANVFAHQGSYIGALNTIAAAAGGYVQPHASLQTLHILPRYPVAPWNWGSVTPDFELPSAVTTRESIEWVERARYNRVFVSGQQAGILGRVTRAGTAGDLLAPMVTDALITTAAAARQRGISVLANTGRQANVSLRLPVLPETGVITPGKFVRYTDAGAARLGIVRSVSVDASFPQVWQSIGVETHV